MLLSEITLPNQTILKNRIVKSAMSETLADKENNPTEKHIHLYHRWAQGGSGLLISGNVMVDRDHLGEPGNVVIDENTDKSILKAWAKAGTENHTKFILQINHPGKQSPKTMNSQPVAPTAQPIGEELKGFFNPPRELTTKEIKTLVEQFVTVGKIAEESGFSGVQIHGAHGYLINQFLSPADNQRTDQYGGSLENRMRFLLEIYQGLREATTPEFIVGLKLNSTDFTAQGFSEEDSRQVILKMAELGIDFVEISGGNYEKTKFMEVGKGAFFLDFAKDIQQQVTTPIILTGGLTQPETMEEVITKEKIAMVGLARALAMNPELPNQLAEGHAQAIQLPRLTTHLKNLDKKAGSIISLSYYEQQMNRLATGKEAKFTTNAWSPLLDAMFRHGLNSLKPRRR